MAATIAAFHRLHERLYTFAQEDTPVEIVTLRVDAKGSFPLPHPPELAAGGPPEEAIVARQMIHFEDGPRECPVYERMRLGRGARIEGPAVIVQLDATTLVLPQQTAEADRFGNLVVTDGTP